MLQYGVLMNVCFICRLVENAIDNLQRLPKAAKILQSTASHGTWQMQQMLQKQQEATISISSQSTTNTNKEEENN